MDSFTTIYPPQTYDFDIDCPCGEKIHFSGTHCVNALHTKVCDKCGNDHTWRSEWCYPPSFNGGAWLCYRLSGFEPAPKPKSPTLREKMYKFIWGSVIKNKE